MIDNVNSNVLFSQLIAEQSNIIKAVEEAAEEVKADLVSCEIFKAKSSYAETVKAKFAAVKDAVLSIPLSTVLKISGLSVLVLGGGYALSDYINSGSLEQPLSSANQTNISDTIASFGNITIDSQNVTEI